MKKFNFIIFGTLLVGILVLLSFLISSREAKAQTNGLSITKTVDKVNAVVGDTLTYTLTVNNPTQQSTANLVVSDVIPTSTSYITGSASLSETPYFNFDGSKISWNLGNLGGMPNAVLQFKVTVNQITPPPTPTVTLAANASQISESGGTADITATLSNTTTSTVTVPLTFTGTAGTSDYTKSGSSISIAAGQTSGKVTVTGTTDSVSDDNETIIATMGTVTGATKGTPASATITIKEGSTPPPPPTSSQYDNTLEVLGRANYDYYRYGTSVWLGASFQSPKTGTLSKIYMPWRTSSGYGVCNTTDCGIYTFQLRSNGTGNFPSSTVLTSKSNVNAGAQMWNTNYSEGWTVLDMTTFSPQYTLQQGQIYHLVAQNSITARYSSLNTLISRSTPWDGGVLHGPRAIFYNGSNWQTLTSNDSPWGQTGDGPPYDTNGSYVSMVFEWSDGTRTGTGIDSASASSPAQVCGTNQVAEYITWNKPQTTIHKVGVPLYRPSGSGTPTVTYSIRKTGATTDLASGTLTPEESFTGIPTWFSTSSANFTLDQNSTYRLSFASSGTPTTSCLYQNIAYSSEGAYSPSWFVDLTYGGAASYFASSANSGSSWTNSQTRDLSFKLAP